MVGGNILKKLLSLSLAVSLGMMPVLSWAQEEVQNTQAVSFFTLPETPNLEIKSEAVSDKELEQQIDIAKTDILLKTQLKKKFSAYKLTITNNSDQVIPIHNIDVRNSVTGNIAADQSEISKYQALWSLAGGLIGLVVFGSMYAGIINGKNKDTEAESLQFNNQFPPKELASKASFSINTIVPKGQMPQLSLNLQNPTTAASFIKTSF